MFTRRNERDKADQRVYGLTTRSWDLDFQRRSLLYARKAVKDTRRSERPTNELPTLLLLLPREEPHLRLAIVKTCDR